MSLTEQEGCAILKRTFTERGYEIAENYPLELDSGTLHLDGFDAGRMVGYEYVTEEEGDRRELSLQLLDELEGRMERRELDVLLLDELDHQTEEQLIAAVDEFLAKVT
jgi:hypothetical protein